MTHHFFQGLLVPYRDLDVSQTAAAASPHHMLLLSLLLSIRGRDRQASKRPLLYFRNPSCFLLVLSLPLPTGLFVRHDMDSFFKREAGPRPNISCQHRPKPLGIPTNEIRKLQKHRLILVYLNHT